MPLTSLPTWRELTVLVLGYLVLDWASYIHPLHGLNITPWNPAPALGLVFLLRFGARAVPPMVIAIVLAETMVRGMPVALPLTFVVAGLIATCFWLIARLLRRLSPGVQLLHDRRDLLVWTAVTLGGTFVSSALFVFALRLAGYVPAGESAAAFLQYWVGDATGILVTMPLLAMLADQDGRRILRQTVLRKQVLLLIAMVPASLWFAFGIGERPDFKYSYVLFLPVAWVASTSGLTGAVVAAAAVQLGIISVVQWQGVAAVTVVEIQLLAVAIALFGFFIGIVVDETRRISNELKQTLRLAAAGEMAGAMAHELNQPLTALTTYGSACEQLLERNETGERLRNAVRAMVQESARAADIMRRLRDFFRTGTTRLESVALAELVGGVLDGFAAQAQKDTIELEVADLPVCRLLCDKLQIEVVLRNLLSNALDAARAESRDRRWIRLSASGDGPSAVCVSVEDSGAGISEAKLARLFSGFQSSKSSGLGLGLLISRAIAEAHGGNLWAESGDHGIFRLSLPVEVDASHAA